VYCGRDIISLNVSYNEKYLRQNLYTENTHFVFNNLYTENTHFVFKNLYTKIVPFIGQCGKIL